METRAARSTSTKEKKWTRRPSRRSFARRSPSTALASRNLRRRRSPDGVAREAELPASVLRWRQRPERARSTARWLRGVCSRRDLPPARRPYERERVDAAVHELSTSMEVVRRPDDGNRAVHEDGGLPHSLDVRVAHGG